MNEPTPEDKILQDELKEAGEIPRHIAIIMDGNGRWAQQKKKHRTFGHKEGVHSVRDIVEASGQIGVKYLTLYTFSTENWKRPGPEINILMKLLIKSLRVETDNLNKNDVKLVAVGDMTALPDKVFSELNDAIKKTSNNNGMTLILALSYSSRWDIVNAARRIASEHRKGVLTMDKINEKTFSEYLVSAGVPYPELLIRTGGEFRLSNFLLWELAYSELYFDERYWPDFRRIHLYYIIREYQRRERRFGLTTKQIQTGKSN